MNCIIIIIIILKGSDSFFHTIAKRTQSYQAVPAFDLHNAWDRYYILITLRVCAKGKVIVYHCCRCRRWHKNRHENRQFGQSRPQSDL